MCPVPARARERERSSIPTRNVVITDYQTKLIDQLVEIGEYQNASEVLPEGICLVEERRATHAAKLEALRAAGMSGRQDARLVREWIAGIGLDPLKHGTHSL